MTSPVIGFIGLGLMGSNMVENLQKKGFEPIVMDLNKEAVAAVVARGATEAASAKELAAASDIVMLCLTTSKVVEALVYAEDGILAGVKEGTVLIDFGTSIPASTRKIGADLAKKGAGMIDAPLGRTPAHAKDGLLNIMASGDKAAFDAVEPVLQDQGENVFYLGAVGSGHTIKLINNFFGMTIANAMAEAFAMADVAGVDRAQLYDVMAAGPLHSGMMGFVKAYGVDGDPNQLAFAIKNAAKDVGYYTRMAEEAGVDSIMSKCALSALTAARDNGRADDMVSQMVDFYVARFGK